MFLYMLHLEFINATFTNVKFIILVQQEGTVKPWPTFNAEADCQTLKKAMKGLGKFQFFH